MPNWLKAEICAIQIGHNIINNILKIKKDYEVYKITRRLPDYHVGMRQPGSTGYWFRSLLATIG